MMLTEIETNTRLLPQTEFDPGDLWTWLSFYNKKRGSRISGTFHIGSQTILSRFIDRLMDSLVMHTKKLELPIRDSSAVGALYFNQLEDLVKDSFRVFFALPSVRSAYLSGANVPLYHSDYLLPVGLVPDDKELPTAILRKIFEAQVDSYVSVMSGVQQNADHRGSVWRSGSCAVVSLDIVTDRKKLKKKAAVAENNEAMVPEAYTLGEQSRHQEEDKKWQRFSRKCIFFLRCRLPHTEPAAAAEDPP